MASSSASLMSLAIQTGEALSTVAPAPPPLTPSYGTLPSYNPPLFFEIVEDEVYRSNKCDSSSFPFLATLQLNTVVYLSYDDLTRELVDFFKERDINVIHLGLKYRSSSHWKGISEGMAKEAIEHILDQRRHPIMVMCKTGVHFAGTIIGCLRRLQNWSLTATIDKFKALISMFPRTQYRNLASSIKTRFENEQFIELFDVDLVTLPQQLPDWFVHNQKLMELERIALMRGECYPGLKRDAIKEKKKDDDMVDGGKETESGDGNNSSGNALQVMTPAYQKYYFYLQGPLASPSVKFSEKKSIIGDDDDD